MLERALAAGTPAVMVTLVAAEGAAPLGVGAQMLFAGEEQAGFLSGGCVEGDVALNADAVLADGAPRRLIYGRGGPPDIQLLCGSRIELLVERLAPTQAARLLALAQARRPALWLSDGHVQLCIAQGEDAPGQLGLALNMATHSAATAGAIEGGAVFRRFDPRSRLVLIGGDPVALALARLAADAGLDVVLIRPKGPVTPPPIAGVLYMREGPAAALSRLKVDPWTAVAALSHDLDIDHEALAAALPSPALYVGALGSRRRIPERLARLRADGVPDVALARLRAPIGLEIHARTPYEIAVSILGEVIAAFRAHAERRAWAQP
jgi:xanthine dehydrogenase accessory factor